MIQDCLVGANLHFQRRLDYCLIFTRRPGRFYQRPRHYSISHGPQAAAAPTSLCARPHVCIRQRRLASEFAWKLLAAAACYVDCLHPVEALERRALVEPDPYLGGDGARRQELLHAGLVTVAV